MSSTWTEMKPQWISDKHLLSRTISMGAYSQLISPFWMTEFPKHWDSHANALPFSKLTHILICEGTKRWLKTHVNVSVLSCCGVISNYNCPSCCNHIIQWLWPLLVHPQHSSSLLLHPHMYPFQKSSGKVYHMLGIIMTSRLVEISFFTR